MLSVVVPTYCERENIRPLIERLATVLGALDEPAELLIMDDSSPDGTAEEARAAAGELGISDRVRVIVRSGNRGLAQAVTEGFREARGDVLAVMDADLSHPPELLPELLAPIRAGRAQATVASRRVPGGGVAGWPLRRRLASYLAGIVARPLIPVRDTTSGFFAIRREAVEGVRLQPRGYKIGLEVLARGKCGAVEEVPFTFTDRRAGASKLGGAVALAYLAQLAALYRFRFPTAVGFMQFGLVGALGVVVDAAVFNVAYWYAGLGLMGAEAGSFLAQTASFAVAAAFNFALNRAWTFRDHSRSARMGVFVLVCAGGYLMRSALVWGMVRAGAGGAAGSWPVLGPLARRIAVENVALLVGIAVASVWNFLASRRWAFPEEGEAEPEDLDEAELARGAASPEARAELRARAAAWALLVGLAAFRLVYGLLVPLCEDEAYYWQWSRHLDWGYYDHPPMVAYLIAAGTRLAGANELGVRLAVVLASSATLWIVFRVAGRLGRSARAGLWAAGMFAAMPLAAAGGFVATPDAPFILFWAASVALMLRALRKAEDRLRPAGARALDWLAVGIPLGLGMLSKYPMVLLPVALLAACAASRRGRAALATPGPYLAALAGAALCVPLIVWQFRSGFASVLFQLGHGLGPAAAKRPAGLRTFGEFLAGQAGVVSPVLFVLAIWAIATGTARLVRAWRGGPNTPVSPADTGATALRAAQGELLAFLVFPAALPLVVFAAASLRARSEANWAAPAYVTAFVLAGLFVARPAGRGRALRALAWTGVALGVALAAYLHVEIARPMYPWRKGPAVRMRDWPALAGWVDSVRRSRGSEGVKALVLADSYQTASLLAFYLADQPETGAPFERGSGSQYLAWRPTAGAPPGGRAPGGNAWYFVSQSAGEPGLPGKETRHLDELFDEYERVGSHRDERLGVLFRTVHACFGRLKEGGRAGVEATDGRQGALE